MGSHGTKGILTKLCVSIFVLRIFGLKIELVFDNIVGSGHGGKFWDEGRRFGVLVDSLELGGTSRYKFLSIV